MKKRLFCTLLAIAMLVGMFSATASVGSAVEPIVLPEISTRSETYKNILDAGIPANEILNLFPETIEINYDEDTGIMTMEDIGADLAYAYYATYEMTLEDGVWSGEISSEEFYEEGATHRFYGGDGLWEAAYTSDGSFEWVDVCFDEWNSRATIYSSEVSIYGLDGDLCIIDVYKLPSGDFFSQNVWPSNTPETWCDVYYTADGEINSAGVYSDNGDAYFYSGGEWSEGLVPSEFSTEAEIKAACPFRAPSDPSEGESSGSTSIEILNLVLNDGETVNRDIPFSTAFKYSAAQYVLTADQLADVQGGCITDLQYWYRTSSAIGRTIEIYLEPYADEKVEAFVDVSPNTKVFEGYVIFASGDKNILTVPLDTPYDYESGNVLVTVIDKTGSYAFDGEVFAYGVNASEEVNAYDWNNALTYVAEELSNETITTRNSSFLPKTGIVYEKPQPTVTLATVDGAQMRITGKQGLRFTSTIAKNDAFADVKEYGTVLIPTENLESIDDLVIGATLGGRDVEKVEAVKKYAEDDESITFTAVITDIQVKNYTRAYTARAYAIMEDDTVVYGDTYTSRSIYQIAQLILEDANASAAEKSAAQAIVDAVADNDVSDTWE